MKTSSRMKAELLRHQGVSIKEIARRVEVSPSTASRWCADISLSQAQKKRLEEKRREAGMRALAPWIRKNKELKKRDILRQDRRGRSDVHHVTKRDLYMLGLGLYWGEGYKRGSQEWGFTNSDSKMIRVVLSWVLQCYEITTDRIIAHLTINERYKDEADRLTKMWSRETGIPFSQFGKPTFIRGYTGSKLRSTTYRGTLRIKIRRGTSLRRRILASIGEIENLFK